MDRDTRRFHQDRWGHEPTPATDRLGVRVRLEQERIDWAWVSQRITYSSGS